MYKGNKMWEGWVEGEAGRGKYWVGMERRRRVRVKAPLNNMCFSMLDYTSLN